MGVIPSGDDGVVMDGVGEEVSLGLTVVGGDVWVT